MVNEYTQDIFNSIKKQYNLKEDESIFDLSEQNQISIQKELGALIRPKQTTIQAIVKTTAPSGVVRYERRTVEL